ncbi:hypothetical protein [Fischerella thermalis]|uniref:hypothetical protein n=1 Tax=Fischerella thermalis TaxID=372787 RepID=UPI00307D39CB
MSIGYGEKITHDHQLPITHYPLPTPTDSISSQADIILLLQILPSSTRVRKHN